MPFSNQPIIPSSSVGSTIWSTAVKAESNSTLLDSSSVSCSYSHLSRGRQFPFLQGPDSPLTASSSAGQMLHHNLSPSSGNVNSSNTQKMLCNDLNQVISSDCALSLLSSSPADTPEMGLRPMNPARSTITGLQYDCNVEYFPGPHSQGLGGQRQPGGSAFMSNMRSSNSLFQDVLRSGTSSGSSASGEHQTLSFSWE